MVLKFWLLLAFLGSAHLVTAQCTADQYVDKALQRLNGTPGFTFLKGYQLDGKGGDKPKIEFSYIFSKDTQYMITLANKDTEIRGLIVNLYDANRQLVGTSYDEKSKKYYPGLGYRSKATGIYYISFTFDGAKDFCAAGVLGFKRN